METFIPFSGFYNSLHDAEFDSALEQMFTDNSGTKQYSALIERAFELTDWGKAHLEYAQRYSDAFKDEFSIPSLQFEKLVSPQFYNFETDRILCTIDYSDVERIFKATDRHILEGWIEGRFTSRSGFISFYSNKLEEWSKDLSQWDCNQVETLLIAYTQQTYEYSPDFDSLAELNIMRSSFEIAYNAIQNAMDAKTDRLFKMREHYNRGSK